MGSKVWRRMVLWVHVPTFVQIMLQSRQARNPALEELYEELNICPQLPKKKI